MNYISDYLTMTIFPGREEVDNTSSYHLCLCHILYLLIGWYRYDISTPMVSLSYAYAIPLCRSSLLSLGNNQTSLLLLSLKRSLIYDLAWISLRYHN